MKHRFIFGLFFLLVLSFPSSSYADFVDRKIGQDVGLCECSCFDGHDTELCERFIEDAEAPETLHFQGRCDVWEAGFVQSSIAFCDQLTGRRCQGFRESALGWEPGVVGRYRCHWSAL